MADLIWIHTWAALSFVAIVIGMSASITLIPLFLAFFQTRISVLRPWK